jgi:hypothetical protein
MLSDFYKKHFNPTKHKNVKGSKFRGAGKWFEPAKSLPDGKLKKTIFKYVERNMTAKQVYDTNMKKIKNIDKTMTQFNDDPQVIQMLKEQQDHAKEIISFVKLVYTPVDETKPIKTRKSQLKFQRKPLLKKVPPYVIIRNKDRPNAQIDIDPHRTVLETLNESTTKYPFLNKSNLVHRGKLIWSRNNKDEEKTTWMDLNKQLHIQTNESLEDVVLGHGLLIV